MTKLLKPNIDLLGKLKNHYLEDLGLPVDFVVTKEDRQSWTDTCYAKTVKAQLEHYSHCCITWDRVAQCWDSMDLPKHDKACAYNEAIRAYPKSRFYNSDRSFKTFTDYYTIEKTGPLTYHCYLNMIGIAVEKIARETK
jgi:hypothetical protein